jgi:hypothetical protein
MVMKGVEDFGSLEAVIMGLKAGVNMFIFRHSDDKTIKMIQELCVLAEKDLELQERILESNIKIKNKFQSFGANSEKGLSPVQLSVR